MLPRALSYRVHSLILREQAQFLWASRSTFCLDKPTRATLQFLFDYVSLVPSPWETPLGLIIPRTPHFESFGDASQLGGGAFCQQLEFWFDLGWSAQIASGCKLQPSHPGYVHINALEFIVLLLQLAATVVRLRTLTLSQQQRMFPSGVPRYPVWLGRSDNTVSISWESKATASSSHTQGLVDVYASLLRQSEVHSSSAHVEGVRNVCADDISRNSFTLPFGTRWPPVRYPLPSFSFLLPLLFLTHFLFPFHFPFHFNLFPSSFSIPLSSYF